MSKKRFARLGAAFLAAVLLLTTTVTTVFATGGVKSGRTVTISFNLDLEKGTTDDFEGNSWSIPSVSENYVSEIVVPTVTAYEGYEFTGWQVDGDKTTTYSHAELVGLFASGKIADLAYFGEGASDGYVTISALFNEDKPVVEERTVNINFNINLEKGEWDWSDEGVWSLTVPEKEVSMIEVTTVTAYEDYEFKGWQVDGDQTTTYSHDELVQLFASGEAANLAYYGDSTEGYMTITALFDEKEPVVEEKRTSVVNFNVDSSMGSFENTTDTTVTKTVEEGTIITFPKVVAKEGYVFVGWKGEGAESINWGADVYSADTTGLCYFYGDDTTGYASVNAVFEEAPAEDEYTIINVVFKSTGGKNLGGGDFVVDADGDGVANYNELPLPEGYELTETGDFFVKDGNSYVITLEKIVEGTIINVQFVDSTTGEVVAGGDYFVDNDDDGIANYNELPVPEGYLLQVVGDFFVNPNETMVVMIDQVIPGTIINVVYKSEGGKNLGGGDFVVDKDGDGVANYSELPLPEGYELIVTGDFQVEEGKSYTIILKKTIEGTIINVVFVDENNENLGGGDFVVDKDDDGIANYSELPLPEGYELIETGDFFVEAGKSYTIVLKKTAADPSDPTDPTDPSDPTDPENPEKPADTNTDKETNTDTPKTGESLPVAAAATMIVAAGAMYVVYRKKVSLQK